MALMCQSYQLMKKMNNEKFLCICLFIIVLILSIIYIDKHTSIRDFFNNINKTDTVITTKTDTLWKETVITEKEFIPKYITKTKIDTLFKENGDTVQLVTESKRFDKTLISDKDTADVQIFTTGIETSLDSLKMRLKTHHEVVTNTVEVIKYVEKPKKFWDRFHVQPQVTGGYDLINKQWGITAGIGVGIDL